MAIIDKDGLTGSLEIVGAPQAIKWGRPWEFIKFLVSALRVRFPVNKGLRFINIGQATPSPDDSDTMWAKSDKNQNPLGWFKLIKGSWRKFYTLPIGAVIEIIGDSAHPPEGFQVLDENVPGLGAALVTELKKEYTPNPNAPGTYIRFKVRYIGY